MLDPQSETTRKTVSFLNTYRAHKINGIHGRPCRCSLEYLLQVAVQIYENENKVGTGPSSPAPVPVVNPAGHRNDQVNIP